ncbi:Ubiquitin-conjugating enzyme E2 N, partial [Gryllus bimaculatus]
MDEFPPKKTKVKTTKVVRGKKMIRPEIRRWLAGYPQITRFRREAQDLIRNAPDGMSAEMDEANERHVFVDMLGPEQSLYEGGLFRLEVFFPAEYPRQAPLIRFMTKIYHPNVDKLGRIRLPEIEEKWTSGRLLREALGALQALLANPN